MTFAAWFDLIEDDEITPTAMRAYGRLIRDPKIYWSPLPIKSWLLAQQLKVERKSVINALDLLVQRGYVLDHGRGPNNVRMLQVPTVRAVPQPA